MRIWLAVSILALGLASWGWERATDVPANARMIKIMDGGGGVPGPSQKP
jgi:hypothetical protein